MELRVGEVLEASITGFVAQAYKLNQPPPLGSLVKTSAGEDEVFAVVYNAYTQPLDTSRHPLARGEEVSSEEELYRNHPQLIKLLHTRFEATTTGYSRKNKIYQLLPERPPNIHSFVYLCTPEEVESFSSSLGFLGFLLEAPFPWKDEAVLACLRYLSQYHQDSQRFLVAAGKELVLRLAGQGYRLNNLLKKLAAL